MSELRADTITASNGTSPVTLTGQTAAKAWVNFNGTGTPAIRQSGNISSITDNSTGTFTANFTSSLTDADFAVSNIGDANRLYYADSYASSSVRLLTISTTGTATDQSVLSAMVVR